MATFPNWAPAFAGVEFGEGRGLLRLAGVAARAAWLWVLTFVRMTGVGFGEGRGVIAACWGRGARCLALDPDFRQDDGGGSTPAEAGVQVVRSA